MTTNTTSTPPAIGSRIEIPVHYDLWMRGARFGTVTGYRQGRDDRPGYVTVRSDHPHVRRAIKLWASDWSFCRVL